MIRELQDRHTKWGNLLMWGGMLATFGLFGYVVFCYRPKGAVLDGVDQVMII